MKTRPLLSLLLILSLFFSFAATQATALTAPSVTAEAVLLADPDSGTILYEKNMHTRRTPASLTKIMTGLLAVEAVERGDISMDTVITAPADCWAGMDYDSSNAEISPGEQMTFGDYLYCALVKSANEACNVVAFAVAGNIQNFINRMNTRAAELGAVNTHFSDTNGLSSDLHYTTAYDLFLISREAMRHELFAEIVDTLSYEINPTNIYKKTRILKNSNALICQDGIYGDDYLYSGASGVKTGYTNAAGYCLVSTAEKDGVRLLAVLLGCNGPLNAEQTDYGNFSGTISLYNWAFRNFAYHRVLSLGEEVTSIPVAYSVGNAPAVLRSTEDITLLLPKDTDEQYIQIVPDVKFRNLTAPVPAGTVLGTASVLVGGNTYATVRLATAETVELDRNALLKAQLQEMLAEPWIKTAAFGAAGIFLVLLFTLLRFRALQRRHLRERQEQEERRALEMQREARLAESRAVQEDMMRFRETLPPEAEKPSSSERYSVKGTGANSRTSETDEKTAALFSSDP